LLIGLGKATGFTTGRFLRVMMISSPRQALASSLDHCAFACPIENVAIEEACFINRFARSFALAALV
jgi:hypothetical protein